MRNGYFIQRLDQMMDHERQEHGTMGFRLTTAANRDSSLDGIAQEVVCMHSHYLAGDFQNITGQEL